MAKSEQWQHFFKPELRRRGEEDLASQEVSISTASDTQIEAYGKGAKVRFSSASITNEFFEVSCNCSQSAKGVFCRHIWSVLKLVEEKHPDFLANKKFIEKAETAKKANSEIFKARQENYKKLQYERHKQRAKALRKAKKKTAPQNFSEEVSAALTYFKENGFEFEAPFNGDDLKNAKKKLSRVFHPDRGGTNEETITLNRHFEVLLNHRI